MWLLTCSRGVQDILLEPYQPYLTLSALRPPPQTQHTKAGLRLPTSGLNLTFHSALNPSPLGLGSIKPPIRTIHGGSKLMQPSSQTTCFLPKGLSVNVAWPESSAGHGGQSKTSLTLLLSEFAYDMASLGGKQPRNHWPLT